MTISIIVAVNEEFCIGENNRLLYNLPKEIQRFKWLTSSPNSIVMMGSETWRSLPVKPLRNRHNVIFTRGSFKLEDKYKHNYNIQVEYDVDKVINHLTSTGNNNDKNVFVIGGASIIGQFAPIADRVFLTMIHDDKKGDTYLNKCFLKQFEETYRYKEYDEDSGLHYSSINYKRKEIHDV